jgi:6-phosphogluconolactonase
MDPSRSGNVSKSDSIRGTLGTSVSRPSFALLLSMALAGVAQASTGAVFTATNDPAGNGIVMYNRAANGTLTVTPGSPFPTGGKGSGRGPHPIDTDPLGAQGSLAVDENSRFLFAVNSGTNEVSVFSILQTGLVRVDKILSGGTFPTSLTVRDNVLYVLNAGNYANVTGFKVDRVTGHLYPLATCPLLGPLNYWPLATLETGLPPQPQLLGVPGQVSFTPSGQQLVIVRKEGLVIPIGPPFNTWGPGRIDVYPLNDDGSLMGCTPALVNVNINNRLPNGRFPFALTFSDMGYLLVTEVLGAPSTSAPFNSSAMSSYDIKRGGSLKLKTGSLANGLSAMCWVARSGQFVYSSNALSDAISIYTVAKNGTLTVASLPAATIPGAGPPDLAIAADGRFLYQLAPGTSNPLDPFYPNASIHAYEINKITGELAPIGQVSTLTLPNTGQAGMATAEF